MASFSLSILTDEISHDLAHALAVAGEFTLTQVDLRAMWNKNIMRLRERGGASPRRRPARRTQADLGSRQCRVFRRVSVPHGLRATAKGSHRHVHCKDVVRTDGKPAWMAMGRGVIDWAGQFRALDRDGFKGALSLETHWRGAGTPEESSRQSLAGLRQLLVRAGAPQAAGVTGVRS